MMFFVKRWLYRGFICFSLLLIGCGLPPGPNTVPDFATLTSSVPLPSLPINSKNPQIAVDSKGIFVVWEDTTNRNILFSSSTDGGSNFSPNPAPIPGSGGGTFPRITTDGNGNAYVIWFSSGGPLGNIYLNYTTSSTFGLTFQSSYIQVSSINAVPPPENRVAPPADITFGNNTLYVAWSQCANCPSSPIYDIFYTSVPLTPPITSASFSNPPVNVTNGTGFSGYPKINLFGTNPFFIYQMTNPSGLFLSKTTPGTQYTIGNSSIASNASLGVDINGNAYVAFNPLSFGSDIYFNTLNANKSLFKYATPINISNNANSYGPAIAIDSSQYVYVAFFSRPASGFGIQNFYDVFLMQTKNGGTSFSGSLNVSHSSGDSQSYAPGFAISGKTAYIVWDDNTLTGKYQIMFQKVLLN